MNPANVTQYASILLCQPKAAGPHWQTAEEGCTYSCKFSSGFLSINAHGILSRAGDMQVTINPADIAVVEIKIFLAWDQFYHFCCHILQRAYIKN